MRPGREDSSLKASRLLLSSPEVQAALGPRVRIGVGASEGPPPVPQTLVGAASVDSAYRRFSGTLMGQESDRPIAVGALALVFDSDVKAERTFAQVADAAHVRAQVDGCAVAVETVTGAGGLVSYWGFLHRDAAIVVLTLDTVDPQYVSVADLRALVSVTAERLEAAAE